MLKQSKREPAFTDTDLMPFGKYKGEPMQDVPASYFRWLWNTDDFGKQYSRNLDHPSQSILKPWAIEKIKVANYIWNSKEAIEQELGDTFI